ncbi:MAG: hypothetical protein QOK31_1450 [Solirubrobacteraceae bacterium]|jgi:hypothetical protein|nr:hypothetical protein [Solirubrobacteraceae bacterium]
MSALDDLPPDQRAVLQLVLQQARSYEDLARLLGISADAVRARAHAGLETLGPDAGSRLSPEHRGLVADYLLGQLSFSERDGARRELAGSGAARAWARVLADQLEPVAREGLPDIPEAEPTWDPEPRPPRRPQREEAPARPRRARLDPSDESDVAISDPRTSRLGGALLLSGLGILVAVVLILLLTGGSDKKKPATTTATGAASGQTGATGATGAAGTQPVVAAQANLTAGKGAGKAAGVVQIVVQGQQIGLVLAAQNLPPLTGGQFFGVWLVNPTNQARFVVPIPASKIKKGRVVGIGAAPSDYAKYGIVIVTRQPQLTSRTPPATPGDIVLQGALQRGKK